MKIFCWEINYIGKRPQKQWKWYARHNFNIKAVKAYLKTGALDKTDPQKVSKALSTVLSYKEYR